MTDRLETRQATGSQNLGTRNADLVVELAGEVLHRAAIGTLADLADTSREALHASSSPTGECRGAGDTSHQNHQRESCNLRHDHLLESLDILNLRSTLHLREAFARLEHSQER